MRLKDAQRQALKAIWRVEQQSGVQFYSTADVWMNGNAANALAAKGLLERRAEHGDIFYRMTDAGREMARTLTTPKRTPLGRRLS